MSANPFKLIEALQRHMAGDTGFAESAYRQVLAAEPDNADAHNLLAMLLEQTGRPGEALACAERALALRPEYPEALNAKGGALLKLGRAGEAVAAFGRAAALAPDYPEAHLNLGKALMARRDFAAALAALDAALALGPDNVEALLEKARLLELRGRLDEAEATARTLRALGVKDPRLLLLEAHLDRRAERLDAALEKLNRPAWDGLPDENPTGALCWFEKGKVLDRLNRPEEAFAAFVEGNRRYGLTAAVDRQALPNMIAHLSETFTADWVKTWTSAPPLERPAPHFILGFPRSGATLLTQAFNGHSALKVLDEAPLLNRATGRLVGLGAYPEVLGDLGEAEIQALRADYFAAAEDGDGTLGAQRLVDKNPLAGLNAGLIHRLFPEAKIILTLRHPCDAVLSCFMQSFVANESMIQFETLESAARFYGGVMGLWTRLTEVLPLEVHVLRYEDLVVDFEGEMRRAVDFLELPWDEGVLAYRVEAAKAKAIATPSYAQVTQPIYRTAVGRWERYRDQMAPVLPLLSPWIEKFGYEA